MLSLYNQGPRNRGLGGFTSHPQRPGALNTSLDTTKSPYVFGIVFKTQKNRKNECQSPPKNNKNWFRNREKRFQWKVDFCNTFHAKTSNPDAQNSKFRHRNEYKKLSGIKTEKESGFEPPEFKKLASTGPRIMLKSLKILFPTTSCPSYGSPGVPGWPRVAKMTSLRAHEMKNISQTIKMGTPRPPKWQLEGATRGQLAKVVAL